MAFGHSRGYPDIYGELTPEGGVVGIQCQCDTTPDMRCKNAFLRVREISGRYYGTPFVLLKAVYTPAFDTPEECWTYLQLVSASGAVLEG